MAAKVTFDPVVHEIIVTVAPVGGVTTLDFKIDIYSDGKEDWRLDDALARHAFPLRTVGGDPIPGGLTLDPAFFIASPWKIRPYDADHELVILGNVFREDGATIFLNRPGRTITATLQTTFSAGAASSGGVTADEIWSDQRALTMGRFLALK